MKLGKSISTVFLVLTLLLIFSTLMSAGCQSLQQAQKYGADEHWVCPEFADVPLRQGRFEEAIGQHLKVLSREPDNALAHYHLGYAYGQLGLHSEEVAEYVRASDLGMERGDLYYNLGMAYLELKEYLQAEQAFHQAVALEPDCGENHRGLGLVHLKQEHYHESVVSCRKASRLEPHDPDNWSPIFGAFQLQSRTHLSHSP